MTVSMNDDICFTSNDDSGRRYQVIDNNALTCPQFWNFQ